MKGVVEDHVLEKDAVLQEFLVVTPLLETALVANDRMGLTRMLTRYEIGQRQLPVSPFPLEMVEETGFVVALDAGHIFMGGGLPRLNVGFHVMANSTESRGLGKLIR